MVAVVVSGGRNSSLVVMKPARTIVRPGFKSRRRHFFLVEEKTSPKILDVSSDPATSKMVNPFGYCGGTDSPIRASPGKTFLVSIRMWTIHRTKNGRPSEGARSRADSA